MRCSIGGAIFGLFCFGLASQFTGWATLFFGHAMAGACLFIAFAIIYYVTKKGLRSKKQIFWSLVAGSLLGWSIVTEFPTAIVVAFIFLYAFIKSFSWPMKKKFKFYLLLGSSFTIFLMPLFIYNYLAFDSPFKLGYMHVVGFDGMKQGFLGIKLPKLDIIYQILFSQYRGLFYFSPVLFIAPIAIIFFIENKIYRTEIILILAVFIYYVLLNSSYTYWHGGASVGPRHLTPVIPFLCLAIAKLYTHLNKFWKTISLILLLYSFSIVMLSLSTCYIISSLITKPLQYISIPLFLNGLLTNIIQASKNITCIHTLFPILLLWFLTFLYFFNSLRSLDKNLNLKPKL